MVCFGTPEAFIIRSGCPESPRASFPAIAPIWSTSILEIRLSATPDVSNIQFSDLPIKGAISFDVSTSGGRYRPVPVIFIFNSLSFRNNI